MSLPEQLLKILACPKDKGPLLYFPDESHLYNPRLRLRFRIEGSIPVMLLDEAETLDDEAHKQMISLASERAIEPNFSV